MNRKFWVFILFVAVSADDFQSENLEKNAKKSAFFFKWKTDKDTITVNITTKSQGWMGIGFSPSGTMEKADIAIFWFDKAGKPHLSGRLGKPTGNGFPKKNPDQYYTLLDSSQNGTHMSATFTRSLTVKSISGFQIKSDSSEVAIIWALNPTSVPEDENTIEMHTERSKNDVILFPKKTFFKWFISPFLRDDEPQEVYFMAF